MGAGLIYGQEASSGIGEFETGELGLGPQKVQDTSELESRFSQLLHRGRPPEDYEMQLLRSHYPRVRDVLQGLLVPPYELEIQPSSRCNLKCDFCFGKNCPRLPDALNSNTLENIVKKVEDFHENGYKIEIVKFCGTTGEPLVNPITPYAIEAFKNTGRKIILFTNGVLMDQFTKEKVPYSDYIVLADKLNVSLDAGRKETFHKIKGKDEFERVLNNVKNVAEKKSRLNKKLNIVASYVITRNNYQEVEEAANRTKNAGADEIRFRIDFTDAEGIAAVSEKVIENLHNAKSHEDNQFKVVAVYSEDEIRKDGLISSTQGKKCFNHHFWASIGPDCNLYACGHRTHCGVKSYGSVIHNSLRDLWLSKQRQESIAALPDNACAVCSPSSWRRNIFMNFLSDVSLDELNRFCAKYI